MAFDFHPHCIGFCDADFSTPPFEIHRLREVVMQKKFAKVAVATRISSEGEIQRTFLRRYLGRLFSFLASGVIGIRLSDTQCGAKMFENNELLREVMKIKPFLSRWIFDVELLGRLLVGTEQIKGIQPNQLVEMHLRSWKEKAESKLKFSDMILSLLDLFNIYIALSALRRFKRKKR